MRYIALACVIGLVACKGDRKCTPGPYAQTDRRVSAQEFVDHSGRMDVQHKWVTIHIDSARTCQ